MPRARSAGATSWGLSGTWDSDQRTRNSRLWRVPYWRGLAGHPTIETNGAPEREAAIPRSSGLTGSMYVSVADRPSRQAKSCSWITAPPPKRAGSSASRVTSKRTVGGFAPCWRVVSQRRSQSFSVRRWRTYSGSRPLSGMYSTSSATGSPIRTKPLRWSTTTSTPSLPREAICATESLSVRRAS